MKSKVNDEKGKDYRYGERGRKNPDKTFFCDFRAEQSEEVVLLFGEQRREKMLLLFLPAKKK